MEGREKTVILDESATARAIMRISHEIAERNKGAENVVLIGVITRGAPLARMIRENIEKIEGKPCLRDMWILRCTATIYRKFPICPR